MGQPFLYPNKPIRFYDINFARGLEDDQWMVQLKWNGDRALVSCDESGRVVVFSRHRKPLKTSADWAFLSQMNLPKPWLLDGEMLVSKTRIMVWDIVVLGGENQEHHRYGDRYDFVKRHITCINGTHAIASAPSWPASSYENLMKGAHKWGKNVEGFVFKRRDAMDLWGGTSTKEVASQLKWRIK